MRVNRSAPLPAQFVVTLQAVEQAVNRDAFLLRADECFCPDLIRVHYLELGAQELLRPLLIRFLCALAVLLSTKPVLAPRGNYPASRITAIVALLFRPSS